MPYIRPERRTASEYEDPATPGELNYAITLILLAYLGAEPDYERYNAVLGVLTAAQLELYRRMVAPYEDIKCRQNGDVYPPAAK